MADEQPGDTHQHHHQHEQVALGVPLLDKLLEANNNGSGVHHHKQHYHHHEGNTSFFKTCFNGLNALSGVGILSVPYALASGGWLTLVLLFIIAMAAFYSGLLIKRCMDLDLNIRTYPDIGGRAFGKTGRTITSAVMCTELYLVVTGFMILEGDNLHKLFPEVALNCWGLSLGGRESFIVIVALAILPSVWLDSLSLLSYVSASGVLASAVILVSIAYDGAFGGIGFDHKGEVLNFKGIPIAVSLYAFCYCAHPVFPTLYTSMRKKQHFSQVLFICFFWSTITYASMAIFGYMMFGSTVESQITLNLSIHTLCSKIAIYTTLVNPVAKFALMIAPVVNATERWFPSCQKKRIFRILIRSALVFSNVVVALTVPFFGSLMSLVGAFLSVTASLIIPCVCYLKISECKHRLEKVTVVSIILLSVIILTFGTYVSVREIIHQGFLID